MPTVLNNSKLCNFDVVCVLRYLHWLWCLVVSDTCLTKQQSVSELLLNVTIVVTPASSSYRSSSPVYRQKNLPKPSVVQPGDGSSVFQIGNCIVLKATVVQPGDVSSMFKCAAQNYLLTTTGPLSPLNLGFVALKPNTTMVRVAEYFVSHFTAYGRGVLSNASVTH